MWFRGEGKTALQLLSSDLPVLASRAPPLSVSGESRKSCTVGMATVILTLLSSAWFPLDLAAHQDALVLAGNLLAGSGAEVEQGLRVQSCRFLFEGWGGAHTKENIVRPSPGWLQPFVRVPDVSSMHGCEL